MSTIFIVTSTCKFSAGRLVLGRQLLLLEYFYRSTSEEDRSRLVLFTYYGEIIIFADLFDL